MSGNRWDQPGVPHKGWQFVDVVDLRAAGESADFEAAPRPMSAATGT